MVKVKQLVTMASYFFLLGAGVAWLFLVLSGANNSGTLNGLYWIDANTEGFGTTTTARTRWYNYKWCGVTDNGAVVECSKKSAAKPFSPKDNFGESPAMPRKFIDDRNSFYYLSRTAWALLIIAFAVTVADLVPGTLLWFSQPDSTIIWFIINSWVSWFFITVTAILYTACYAEGKKAFKDGGHSAKLGVKNFALLWTSFVLSTFTTIWNTYMAISTGPLSGKRSRYYRSRFFAWTPRQRDQIAERPVAEPAAETDALLHPSDPLYERRPYVPDTTLPPPQPYNGVNTETV